MNNTRSIAPASDNNDGDFPYQSLNDKQPMNPPLYATRQQGYVVPQSETYEQPQGRESPSFSNIASGMAMEYVKNGKLGSGKKGQGSDSASNVIGSLFK